MQRKFCQYWPTNPGEEKTYGEVMVKLVSEKEQSHYTLRKMELRMEHTYVNLAAGVQSYYTSKHTASLTA